MDIELDYIDLGERYRTLQLYSIEVSEADQGRVGVLSVKWSELELLAETTDTSLVKVKKKFGKTTVKGAGC